MSQAEMPPHEDSLPAVAETAAPDLYPSGELPWAGDVASARSGWPAFVASFSFHLILLMIAAVLNIRSPSSTAGPAKDHPVGVAVVHRMPDRQALEIIAEPDEQAAAQAVSEAGGPPPGAAPPIVLADVLAELQAAPQPGPGAGAAGGLLGDAASLRGGDTTGLGDGMGLGDGTQRDAAASSASLFGVGGSGNRFVYVMDRSDSMNGFGGRPLRAAKRELTRSLRSLSSGQEFTLIFYNDRAKPFAPSGTGGMLPGEDAMVDLADRYIQGVRAYGGTEHLLALKEALRYGPDVIFFLTDANVPSLSARQLSVLHERAARSGTVIHAVEFGTSDAPEPNTFLKKLAKMNRGQYQYLDVRTLQ
ncbi:MAG: hypothetical protein AAF958_08060 [Planctomycetota bacterium]